MSICVAVQKNGQTVIAADTLFLYGNRRLVETQGSKLIRYGRAVFGQVGWSKYIQELRRFCKQTPDVWHWEDEHEVALFFLRFWEDLRAKNLLAVAQVKETTAPFLDLDSSFIVATSQRLFMVDSHLFVVPCEQFVAIGSGERYALGVLRDLSMYRDIDADMIAGRAVAAAIAFDPDCGGEVQLECIP